MPKFLKYFRLASPKVIYSRSFLIILIFITAFIQSAQAERGSCDRLIVGGTNNTYPNTYIDPTISQPQEMGYKLARQLGDHIGIPVNIKSDFPWARMMNMAREGAVDIVASLIMTPERAKFLIFTAPYKWINLYVFVHRDSKIHFTRMEDLLKYRRVEIRNSSMGVRIDRLLQPVTIEVSNQQEQIALVLEGRADYFINSKTSLSQDRYKYLNYANIKQLPLPVDRIEMRLAISKASPCAKYIVELNRIINQIGENKE
jgi:ABC-type amino acid transport substrate-binding protein